MNLTFNRREAITLMSSFVSMNVLATVPIDDIVNRHDQQLDDILKRQNTNAQSQWCGAYPNSWGLYSCGSAGRIVELGTALYLHPQSRHHHNKKILQRIKLAVDFLKCGQSSDGLIDLLTTNFDSPPDTGFVVHHVATAAKLARIHKAKSIESMIKPFLIDAGHGMAEGGIHTPNHRWVVSAALAQIHDLYPDPRFIKRIDQWLAEGIDIDAEGQFIERSTTVYNAVSDNSLVTLAHKLNRPELLETVRQNLNAMLYLLHPGYEVVTEISRRQDINTQGTMRRYWFALRYMAHKDQNGQYATIVHHLEPEHISLPLLMEYQELQKPLPPKKAIPTDYVKSYPLSEITRIRHGKTSAVIMHKHNNRWFSLRRGKAVINAVRFASAFFGKGQFNPDHFEEKEGVYYFEQHLQGPYYQPIDNPSLLPVTREHWGAYRGQREKSNICRMTYKTTIREISNGFELHIHAYGTENVPLAIEINLRDGGKIEGVKPAPNVSDAFLLPEGYVIYKMGEDMIRFGPGLANHAYTQVRGAEAKLTGPSIYLTAYTPFEHTLTFEFV